MAVNTDIIYYILKEYANSTSENLEEWKLQLPVLAVCRAWRRIAQPIVYSRIYITCSKNERVQKYGSTQDTEPSSSPVVISNMDLATSLGFHTYAKSVYIVRACPMNLYDYISQAICVLERYENKWKHVSSLLFKTISVAYPFSVDPGRIDIHNIFTFERLNQLASCLLAAMPNLVHLCTAQNNDVSLIAVVENRIVSMMACQFKSLDTKISRYISAIRFSRDLTCLRLTFVPASIQNIPKVCAPMLRQLELYGVFHTFSWSSFCDASDKPCLEFTKLEKLCVHFANGVDMLQNNISMTVILGNDFFKRFRFPKLKYLSINQAVSCGTLLRYASFPHTLKCFEISISSKNCAQFWNVRLGETERYGLVNYYANSANSSNPLGLSNYLFSNTLDCKNSELVLDDRILVSDTKRIDWRYLRKLRIIAPLDLIKLLEIVSVLQHLEALYVNCLTFVPGMTLALDVDAKQIPMLPPKPINTSIKTLHLELGLKGSTDDTCFTRVIKYLVLRIPTLQQLRIGKGYSDKIRNFVSSYSDTVPHLSGIALCFQK